MNDKSILLIDPGIRLTAGHFHAPASDPYFPRGAMSITTFLRARGIDVDFLFLDSLAWPENPADLVPYIYGILKELLEQKDRAIVAIGGPFTIQYPLMREIARTCRELSPRSHITLGGTHVTFLPAESLAETGSADSIIMGEGEWTLHHLFHALCAGEDLEKVDGLAFRRDGKTYINAPRSPGDLSELPIIDYGLLPPRFYDDTMINLTASRGCAYKCTFCAEWRFWGKKVRAFPVETLLEEVRRISRLSTHSMFSLEDSMLSLKSPFFFAFCDALRGFREKEFMICYIMSRVDTVSDEGFMAMKKARILSIDFGVESLSEKVLKVMNKGITKEQVHQACRMAQKNHVPVRTLWIYGHPGDNSEESEKTLDAVKELYDRELHQTGTASLFVPYPGTPLFQEPDRYGLTIHKGEWNKWERYSPDRPCELEDYPTGELLNAYRRAGKLKMECDETARLRYFARAGVVTGAGDQGRRQSEVPGI